MRIAKSYEMFGKEKTLSEWSILYGMPTEVVVSRVCSLGWELQRALTTPVKSREMYRDKFRVLAVKNGINESTYKQRVAAGWSRKDAATTPAKWTRKKKEEPAEDTTAKEEAMFAVLKFVWGNLDIEKKERLMHMIKVAAEMWAQEKAS